MKAVLGLLNPESIFRLGERYPVCFAKRRFEKITVMGTVVPAVPNQGLAKAIRACGPVPNRDALGDGGPNITGPDLVEYGLRELILQLLEWKSVPYNTAAENHLVKYRIKVFLHKAGYDISPEAMGNNRKSMHLDYFAGSFLCPPKLLRWLFSAEWSSVPKILRG
jgi:hypothetical protein